MSITILRGKDVEQVTSRIHPIEVIDLMKAVFTGISSQGTLDLVKQTPHRSTIDTGSHTTLFMPARFGMADSSSEVPATTAIKIVSVPRSRENQEGLPATTIIMDEQTGGVRGIINARTLTAIRTSAGSALATLVSLGARLSEVKEVVMFGAGLQIYWHAWMLLHLIKQNGQEGTTQTSASSRIKVTIVNRRQNERLKGLLKQLEEEFGSKSIVIESFVSTGDSDSNEGLKAIVEKADVICTATSSRAALFPSSFIPEGKRVHINLIGSYTPEMREIDDDLVKRAGLVLVDSREACLKEAGELIGAGLKAEDLTELGEAVTSKDQGWGNGIQTLGISVFKSVGIGSQDVAIGHLILRKAEELSLGVQIPEYD